MRSLRIAAPILICALAAGCWPGRPEAARSVVPELVMEGVRFTVERKGITRARGEADRLTYRRDTTALTAEQLAMDLEGQDGRVRVTAPKGEGTGAERRFDVAGGLTATRGADVATTASARFEGSPSGGPGLVFGDEPVTVAGPGYRLTGHGFTLQPASGELLLSGGAHLVTGLPVTP